MIRDIKAGEKLSQAVILRVQKVAQSVNGNRYAKGTAEDNSGTIQFITFEPEIVRRLGENIGSPCAMRIQGPTDMVKYSSAAPVMQVNIQKMSDITDDDDLSALLPGGNFSIESYKAQLAKYIEMVHTPTLKSILGKIFSGQFLEDFCRNPAGTKLHHAYVGGLLQHSVDVTRLAVGMAMSIEGTNTDLVIAGALLHDIGKVKEISAGIGFPYTTEGRLLGHISISAMMVEKAASSLNIPMSRTQELLHIILSHHGDQSKGSPMACATREAFIVHYADEINAIMNQFDEPKKKLVWDYNQMLQRFLMIKNA